MKPPPGKLLVGIASVVVLTAIVAALGAIGPPARVRERRMDERRETDLGEIAQAIDYYRASHSSLPSDLTELSQAMPGVSVRDPESQQLYEYRVLEDRKYEVCAVFHADSAPRGASRWAHPTGRHCFQRQSAERTR